MMKYVPIKRSQNHNRMNRNEFAKHFKFKNKTRLIRQWEEHVQPNNNKTKLQDSFCEGSIVMNKYVSTSNVSMYHASWEPFYL